MSASNKSRLAEQVLVQDVCAAGYTLLSMIRRWEVTRQIQVRGDGDIELLQEALAKYLIKTRWVFVEAIIEGKPRRRMVVAHQGTVDDPKRLITKLDILPRLECDSRIPMGEEVAHGVRPLGNRYIAIVGDERIGSYATVDDAIEARENWIAMYE